MILGLDVYSTFDLIIRSAIAGLFGFSFLYFFIAFYKTRKTTYFYLLFFVLSASSYLILTSSALANYLQDYKIFLIPLVKVFPINFALLVFHLANVRYMQAVSPFSLTFIYFFIVVCIFYLFHHGYGFYAHIVANVAGFFVLLASLIVLLKQLKKPINDIRNYCEILILLSIYSIFIVALEFLSGSIRSHVVFQIINATFILFLTYYLALHALFLFKSSPEVKRVIRDKLDYSAFASFNNADINRVSEKLQHFVSRKEFTDPELNLSILALKLDIQEYKLRKYLNQQLGNKSINDFLNKLRVEEAKSRLQDPSFAQHSITQIAYDVGFSSLAPFYRVFKELTGTTPTAFRKHE